MLVESLAIHDVKLITPKRIADSRGFFAETYSHKILLSHGIDVAFVQDNQSLSVESHVLRGLHFQLPPFAQAKLVRVLRGSIWDVAVDIRRGSPSFGKHVAVELSAENFQQLLVPVGFAHGFLTLQPNTEVAYKVSSPYSKAHDRGILFSDPALQIEWPLGGGKPVLSDKDLVNPLLKDAAELF